MTLINTLHILLSAPKAVGKLRGNALKLEDAGEGVEAKWVQVAVAGEFLGYGGPDHPGFEITRATFEEVIANIHTHPSFKMGAGGFGEEGVIPWDFSHASEQRPTEGAMPIVGAPSQGWSSDAQIRNGADGKAELWMLTKFGEPARTYVLSGQYKWASVALSFESVDNVTGDPTGAVVTSIALTNRPFIEGMAQLAAENRRNATGTTVTASRGCFYEAADSPGKAVEMMKEMFGIPETSLASDLGVELAKVSGWIAAGSAPIGIDVDEMVSSLRTILGMEPFSTAQQVLSRAESNIANLGDQTAPLSTLERTTMDILKVLAALLGVGATQEAITAELESLKNLRDKLVTLFDMDLSRASTAALLQAAADANAGAKTLLAIVGALAVKDGTEAITSISALQASTAELEELKPKLVALQKVQEEAELVEINADVDRALASNSAFDEGMRPMFILSRQADKAAFLTKYPVPEGGVVAPVAGATAAQLTASVAATTAGVQLAVPPTVAAPAVVVDPMTGAITRPAAIAAAVPAAATGVLGGVQVNLALYPGATEQQKMIAHLTATRAGFKDQTWEDQCEAAFLALAELKKAA